MEIQSGLIGGSNPSDSIQNKIKGEPSVEPGHPVFDWTSFAPGFQLGDFKVGAGFQNEAEKRSKTNEKVFHCILCGKSFTKRSNLNRHVKLHTGERNFSCELCHKSFAQKSDMKNHMKTHTGEKNFNCVLCNKWFSEKSNLTRHLKIHTGEKPFCCEICSKSFSRKSDLITHSRIHTRDMPYVCRFCNLAFPSSSNLNRHMQMHVMVDSYESEEQNLQAENTDEDIPKEKSEPLEKSSESPAEPDPTSEKHDEPATGMPEKRFCKVCGKWFSGRSNYKRHLRTHTGEKPFHCETCSKSFTRKDDLICHIRSHQGEMPFSCYICSKSFVSAKRLNRHINIHIKKGESGREKLDSLTISITPKTDEAGQTLVKNEVNELHIKQEVDETELDEVDNCTDVAYDYHDDYDENSEERISVKTENEVTFENFCENYDSDENIRKDTDLNYDTGDTEKAGQENYVSLEDFCEKYENSENEVAEDNDIDLYNSDVSLIEKSVKTYCCNQCDKWFSYKSNFTRHMRTHSGLKPFVCDVCKKCFLRKDELGCHYRTHTGEKPYTCVKCNKSFFSRTNLSRHMKTYCETGESLISAGYSEGDLSCSSFLEVEFDGTQETEPSQTNDTVQLGSSENGDKRYMEFFEKEDVDKVNSFLGDRTNNCSANEEPQSYSESHIDKHIEKDDPSNSDKIASANITISCCICDKELSSSASLEKHMEVHGKETIVITPKTEFDPLNLNPDAGDAFDAEGSTEQDRDSADQTGSEEIKAEQSIKVEENEEDEDFVSPENLSLIEASMAAQNEFVKYLDRPEKKYCCELCMKWFSSKSNFTRHLRAHSGERPFSCEVCEKSFARKSDLNCHYRTHTGEKPYSCPTCNKSFFSSTNLSRHKRTHLKDSVTEVNSNQNHLALVTKPEQDASC